MLYPLFFTPIYKSAIWGGQNLKTLFNRALPDGKIAESWEICCHKNGMSIVSNGYLKGKSLEELMHRFKIELLGTKFLSSNKFPLLIKLLDAKERLSVQVHPNDEYCLKYEGDLGKTEMWYVVDANENSKLIVGANKGIDKKEFKNSILNGSLEKHLNFIPVKKGDAIFIPSGTIHAIFEGVIILEIQQNSDTTYRVYDWNRLDSKGKGRELHIERAMDVINFNYVYESKKLITTNYSGFEVTKLIQCKYFNVDKININCSYHDKASGESMHLYTCTEGTGTIEHEGMSYDIPCGSSFLIPAIIGDYIIKGSLTLLKTYL